MSTQIDANGLVEAGLLDCADPSSGAERFCTDLCVRVLGHERASGAAIIRVTEKATWQHLGGYGSLNQPADSLDDQPTSARPDYLVGLREGYLSSAGGVTSGHTLHTLALNEPFLGVLLIDTTPEATFAPGAVELLRHSTEYCLSAVPGSPSTDRRRSEPVDGSFFSPRQLEVLTLVAEGKSNTEIGRKLSISASLAKLEVTFLMHALGARNRLDAVVQAQRSGLLPTGSAQPPLSH